MRKTSKITLVALLALALVATLCACGLLSGATALTIESMPRTSYTTEDQNYDWTGFTLRVYTNTKKDDTYKKGGNNDRWYKDFSYDDLMKEGSKDFSVTPFAKGQVGTHTAQIRYLGLSVSFNYTVSESLFAGGEGTKANPYQISTAEQFERIGSRESTTYFVLINDIDLENYNTVRLIKNAEIDGSNYALRNVNKMIAEKFAGTIKNVDIYMNSQDALFLHLGRESSASVLVENVNVYGVLDLSGSAEQNTGILANYVSSTDCKIKDVNIYANLLSNTNYGAIFIGYTNYYDGDIYFENARFYGYAQGRRLGIFMGNTASALSANSERNINIDDKSGNFGTIITTMDDAQAFLFADSGNHNPQKDNRITIKKNGVELTTEENKDFFNKEGSESRKVYEPSLKLTVENNELVIGCTNTEVKSYSVIAEVWTYRYLNENRGEDSKEYTSTFTLLSKEGITNVGATGVYLAKWVLDTESDFENGYEYNAENNEYSFNDMQLLKEYVKANAEFGIDAAKRLDNVRYTVFAYGEGGKVIGSFTYGL